MLPSVKLVGRHVQHAIDLVSKTLEHKRQMIRFARLHRLAGLHGLHRSAGLDVWHVNVNRLAGRWKRFDFLYRRKPSPAGKRRAALKETGKGRLALIAKPRPTTTGEIHFVVRIGILLFLRTPPENCLVLAFLTAHPAPGTACPWDLTVRLPCHHSLLVIGPWIRGTDGANLRDKIVA